MNFRILDVLALRVEAPSDRLCLVYRGLVAAIICTIGVLKKQLFDVDNVLAT